jgi:hypothetical protein
MSRGTYRLTAARFGTTFCLMPETVSSLAKRLSVSESSLLARLKKLGSLIDNPSDVVPESLAAIISNPPKVHEIGEGSLLDGGSIRLSLKDAQLVSERLSTTGEYIVIKDIPIRVKDVAISSWAERPTDHVAEAVVDYADATPHLLLTTTAVDEHISNLSKLQTQLIDSMQAYALMLSIHEHRLESISAELTSETSNEHE